MHNDCHTWPTQQTLPPTDPYLFKCLAHSLDEQDFSDPEEEVKKCLDHYFASGNNPLFKDGPSGLLNSLQ